MTHMRVQTLGTAVVLLSVTLAAAADSRSACELLPESLVSSITGSAVHVDPRPLGGHDARRDVCTYLGDGNTFTFSVISLESERKASREFTREVTRTFGAGPPGHPLRGVGVEARFRASEHSQDNTIIARHGSVVFALTGPANQEAVVALARSVVARLERPDPK